jgi:hypothetical protein
MQDIVVVRVKPTGSRGTQKKTTQDAKHEMKVAPKPIQRE